MPGRHLNRPRGGGCYIIPLFLLTSREDPLPTVVLEALSVGTPVIAFEGSGGVPELLRRHCAGQAVKLADIEAMARAVAAGKPPRPKARQRLAAIARRHYAFDRYAEALLRLAQPGLIGVSVVVPSYNYARHMQTRLASIFGQTYPVLEVIVLDDASTDDSVAVARQTAAAWGRDITVIESEANSGSVFRQWQRAAELAQGDYLWIAEADDFCDVPFLERLAEALARAPDALLAFTDSRAVDAEDQPVRPNYRDYYAESAGVGALGRDDVFEAAGFVRRFLSERNLILNASAVLWRRSALLAAFARCGDELTQWRLAGDWRLYVEVLTGAPGTVAYVAEPLNVHRRHGDGVTQRLTARRHVQEIGRMHALTAGLPGAEPDLPIRQRAYLQSVVERMRPKSGGSAPPAPQSTSAECPVTPFPSNKTRRSAAG